MTWQPSFDATREKASNPTSDHNRSIPVSYELPLDILNPNKSIPVSYELPFDP
jgi:hypothetical protein